MSKLALSFLVGCIAILSSAEHETIKRKTTPSSELATDILACMRAAKAAGVLYDGVGPNMASVGATMFGSYLVTKDGVYQWEGPEFKSNPNLGIDQGIWYLAEKDYRIKIPGSGKNLRLARIGEGVPKSARIVPMPFCNGENTLDYPELKVVAVDPAMRAVMSGPAENYVQKVAEKIRSLIRYQHQFPEDTAAAKELKRLGWPDGLKDNAIEWMQPCKKLMADQTTAFENIALTAQTK